jgi:hypothetical protein
MTNDHRAYEVNCVQVAGEKGQAELNLFIDENVSVNRRVQVV